MSLLRTISVRPWSRSAWTHIQHYSCTPRPASLPPITSLLKPIPPLPETLTIFQILHQRNMPVCASGWIRAVRAQKKYTFLELMDGTCCDSLQVVVKGPVDSTVRAGAAVQVHGDLVESPKTSTQKVELHANRVEVVGACDHTCPIQAHQHHKIDHMRHHMHLRPRTEYMGSIQRIRHTVVTAMHQFFSASNHMHVHTPILTSMDCEGGGHTFSVLGPAGYFGTRDVRLTVSSQLHLEIYACTHPRVYTLSPCFRAEKTQSTKHLAEFYMLEVEHAFVSTVNPLLNTVMDLLHHVAHSVHAQNRQDLAYLQTFHGASDARLRQFLDRTFVQLSYSDAIEYLRHHPCNLQLDTPVTEFGDDLLGDHEQILAEAAESPVFITNYPMRLKPFYMASAKDGTAECFDLLVPALGELAGGSVRINCRSALMDSMRAHHLDADLYAWYLELRKFGAPPHAGFGLGLDRLVKYLTGVESVREVVPIPRYFGDCKY